MADIQVGTANTIWQRGWFKIALIYKFLKGCVLKGKTVCLVTGPDEMRRRGNKVCRHEDLGFIK